MKNKQLTIYRQHEISRSITETAAEREERENNEKIARRLSKFVLKRVAEGETDIKIGFLRGLTLGDSIEFTSEEVNDLVNAQLLEHDIEVDPYVNTDSYAEVKRGVAVTRIGDIEPTDSKSYRRAKIIRNSRPFGWPFLYDVDEEALRIKEQDVVMLCDYADIDFDKRYLTTVQVKDETERTKARLSMKLHTMFSKQDEKVTTLDGVYKKVDFEIEKLPSVSGIAEESSYKIIISWPSIEGLSTIAFIMIDDSIAEPTVTIDGKDLDEPTTLKLVDTAKQIVSRRTKTEITPR